MSQAALDPRVRRRPGSTGIVSAYLQLGPGHMGTAEHVGGWRPRFENFAAEKKRAGIEGSTVEGKSCPIQIQTVNAQRLMFSCSMPIAEAQGSVVTRKKKKRRPGFALQVQWRVQQRRSTQRPAAGVWFYKWPNSARPRASSSAAGALGERF